MTDERKRDKLLNQIRDVRDRLTGIAGLSLQELDEVEARLQENRYLIAVFGAFSAGKSSLLNALLGQALLTVSPNPTTASVTQLEGSIGDKIDVVVTAKTEAELWRDVESTFAALHEHPATLSEAIARAATLNPRDYPTALRSHLRFLKAIHSGYEEMSARLGTQWHTTVSELQSFSAIEQYAAYVSRVDVHAAHPWLQKGFLFVDTPGVDSIHRRHTDVAFRYMRRADAIVFVMYYSHAFTQGDRDFLLQLSGVQDVAQANKLFAVINAVDLAKSEDERVAVRTRVEQEMRRLGMRFPRIYEVSAQIALAARQLAHGGNDAAFEEMARARLQLAADAPLPEPDEMLAQSGVTLLETDLTNYVEQEGEALAGDMVARTLRELARQIKQFIEEANMRQAADDAAKQARIDMLTALKERLESARAMEIESKNASVIRQFDKELAELVFHAAERLRLRYRDLFRDAYNPGRFRLGKPQDKLREAASALCDALARQVDIETRTFSLRAANLAEQTSLNWLQKWQTSLAQAAVSNNRLPRADFSNLVVEDVHCEISSLPLEQQARHFSTGRQFFEGGGQRAMLDATEEGMMEFVRQALADTTRQIIQAATLQVQSHLGDGCAQLLEQVRRAIEDTNKPFDASLLAQLRQAFEYLGSLGFSE
ncbi:dynamin family protein [Alicyclobacillus fodiniaquatilis]|uniref:Dynamin family protein n=1 Tax=Alicyclobacillus fodiniaquatilis TaxID=1661150 RepID=A0ABW4JD54_9BACL